MLSAGIHLSPIAVHNIHRLLDIQASCCEIRAIPLIARGAEGRNGRDSGIGDGEVVDCGDQAVIFKSDLQVREALIHIEVVHLFAG